MQEDVFGDHGRVSNSLYHSSAQFSRQHLSKEPPYLCLLDIIGTKIIRELLENWLNQRI